MNNLFEHIWQGVGVVTVIAVGLILGKVIIVEKKIDGYYLAHGTDTATVTCVFAHWTWHPDEKAFCTNDVKEALDVLDRANATIRP